MGAVREMYEEENEVSLLDLLVVVAENLKLLLFVPVAVGLLAWAIAYSLPQSFVSQSILTLPTSTPTPTPTPTQVIAVMVSPLVLDPVIEALNLTAGHTNHDTRMRLAKQIDASVGKDGLVRLDVTANTPALAQTLANAIIDTWLKTTLPGQQDRADLEKRLAYATASLKSVDGLLERLSAEGLANLNKSVTRGDVGVSIVAMGELQTRYLGEILNTSRALRGLSRDVVVQPPTRPTEAVAPKKGLIAFLAVLASGLALLLWVFLRQAWSNAAQDPQAAEKQARLRATLGFKGGTQ